MKLRLHPLSNLYLLNEGYFIFTTWSKASPKSLRSPGERNFGAVEHQHQVDHHRLRSTHQLIDTKKPTPAVFNFERYCVILHYQKREL